MRINTIIYKGKEIINVDCTGLSISDKKEIAEILQNASQIVSSKPKGEVLIITAVSNVRFDDDIFTAFKNYATNNAPYTKGSAIVGLSAMQKIMLNAIKTITKKNYYIAKSMDDAKEYLVNI